VTAEHAFDIDSTVGQYWLANGSGFGVVERGGRKLGVVEDVVLDPATHHVAAVVIRRRIAIGRARVSPQVLTAVVPAAQLFVVRPGSSGAVTHTAGRAIASSASSEVRRVASASAPVLATAARAFARGVSVAARWLAAIAASGVRQVRAKWPAVRHALATAGAALLGLLERGADSAARGARHARRRLRER
jgi:hypothetical protein